MPSLTLASAAVAAPMGAQVYEEAIAARAADALDGDWTVRRAIVRSTRSALPGTHRLPIRMVANSSDMTRAAIGRLMYPRAAVVHRMNLELPPGRRDVVTLHDIVSWKYADESPPVKAAPAELRRARAVICVSSYSAQEAVAFLGIDNPIVIHNGVSPAFINASPLAPSQRQALGITGAYVLAGGGASARKNLGALAEAWPVVRRARPDLALVLSGPSHPRRDSLFAHVPGALMVGRVDRNDMPGLFAGATAVVVPSQEEGFGLPALEAMAARTPVVTSNTSSFPEVVGDAGLLVPPTAAGLAEGILQAVTDSTDVRAMVDRGAERVKLFTWERAAEAHAQVWRAVFAQV